MSFADSISRSYRRQSRQSIGSDRRDAVRRATTIAHGSEVERLLGEPRRPGELNGKKLRAKGRAQQMPENGEALKYIELVLRQLRRASRDHRQLLEQRHCEDIAQPLRKSSATREYQSGKTELRSRSLVSRSSQSVRGEDQVVRDSWEKPQRASREVRRIEEPRELVEYTGPEVATKLLVKRKTYAGGGISILETMPRRIEKKISSSSRYVPAYEGIDTTIIQ